MLVHRPQPRALGQSGCNCAISELPVCLLGSGALAALRNDPYIRSRSGSLEGMGHAM